MGKVIAVDFDGTISVGGRFPETGAANVAAIRRLNEERRNGAKVILWTCRTGGALQDALAFCRFHGLELDAVNENLPELIEKWGADPRKICADEYWDDKAARFDEPSCDNCRLRRNSAKPKKSIYTWCANSCKNYSPR